MYLKRKVLRRNVKDYRCPEDTSEKKNEFVPLSVEEKIYSKSSWQFRKRIQD